MTFSPDGQTFTVKGETSADDGKTWMPHWEATNKKVSKKASAQTGPEIGTWKMNAAKSTFNPGPAPKSMTVVFAAVGQSEKLSVEMVAADGSKLAATYTANYDGKDVPFTGLTDETVSLKRINATTTEQTVREGGKVVVTYTRVVSADGKSLTSTAKGTNAQGQAFTDVVVLDKQ